MDCLPLGPKTLDILMGGTLAGPGTIFSKYIRRFNISLHEQKGINVTLDLFVKDQSQDLSSHMRGLEVEQRTGCQQTTEWSIVALS